MVANLAREMVTLYGMSDLGPVALESPGQEVFLGRDWGERAEYSQEMGKQIDRHVREIAAHCYQQARTIIRENRALVDRIVDLLVEQETIEGDEFRKLVAEYTQRSEKQKLSVV